MRSRLRPPAASQPAGPQINGGFAQSLGRSLEGERATTEAEAVAELLSHLRRGQPNALIIGPVARSNLILGVVFPHLLQPVVTWGMTCSSIPLVGSAGTLIVHDVASIDRRRQRLLLDWTTSRPATARVFSTSRADLYPLVANGRFLDSLYYRLNTILLQV
jgi:hypothetical protein